MSPVARQRQYSTAVKRTDLLTSPMWLLTLDSLKVPGSSPVKVEEPLPVPHKALMKIRCTNRWDKL